MLNLVVAHGLSLVATIGGYSLVLVGRLLIEVTSLVAGFRARKLQ